MPGRTASFRHDRHVLDAGEDGGSGAGLLPNGHVRGVAGVLGELLETAAGHSDEDYGDVRNDPAVQLDVHDHDAVLAARTRVSPRRRGVQREGSRVRAADDDAELDHVADSSAFQRVGEAGDRRDAEHGRRAVELCVEDGESGRGVDRGALHGHGADQLAAVSKLALAELGDVSAAAGVPLPEVRTRGNGERA